jgi:hypothetical protein
LFIEQEFDIIGPVELALDLSDGPAAHAAAAAPPLADALTALGERVAPISLARERTLPLPGDLSGFFPEGGLVRGRSVQCTGPSATSLALSLVAPAIAGGSWLAFVDLPTIGLDAASEYGVPLERVVRIDTVVGDEAHRWSDVVAAAADGFDVLMVRVPPGIPPTVMRKVMTRVQQRGAVVVVVGDSGSMLCDAELTVDSAAWHGVTTGAGHLRQRTITVRSGGRRMHGRCRRDLLLPDISQS